MVGVEPTSPGGLCPAFPNATYPYLVYLIITQISRFVKREIGRICLNRVVISTRGFFMYKPTQKSITHGCFTHMRIHDTLQDIHPFGLFNNSACSHTVCSVNRYFKQKFRHNSFLSLLDTRVCIGCLSNSIYLSCWYARYSLYFAGLLRPNLLDSNLYRANFEAPTIYIQVSRSSHSVYYSSWDQS